MRRSVLLLVAVLTACTTAVVETTTSAPEPTTTTESTTSTTGVSAPSETIDPPVLAPDFTLELGDGSTFVLSESDMPVYLLFWAEWCPVCRKEIPMIDNLAAEYAGSVEFVAPVWKSAEEYVLVAVDELMPSGVIKWGLDIEGVIFDLYQVPYQPVTVLINPDRTVLEAWAGVRSEERIRASLEALAPTSR